MNLHDLLVKLLNLIGFVNRPKRNRDLDRNAEHTKNYDPQNIIPLRIKSKPGLWYQIIEIRASF